MSPNKSKGEYNGRTMHWQGTGSSVPLWYTLELGGGGYLGETRAKRAIQRTRTVLEDWVAWIPNEMDQLFDATRTELESSTSILNITLDEALSLCKRGQFDSAKESANVFAGLFDRLAVRVSRVVRAIKDHGTHFGIVYVPG